MEPVEPVEWWQKPDAKVLLEFDADGAYLKRVFARRVRAQWEYAVVTMTDGDGTPAQVVTLRNGRAAQESFPV